MAKVSGLRSSGARLRQGAVLVGAGLLCVSVTAGAQATDRDSWFDPSVIAQRGDGWESNIANDEMYFGLNLVNKDGRCQIEIRQVKYFTSKLEYRLQHIPTSVFNVFKVGYSTTSGPMTVEYFEPKPTQHGEYQLQWWFTPGDNGPTKRPNPKVNYPGGCPSAAAPKPLVKEPAAAPTPAKEEAAKPSVAASKAPSPLAVPVVTASPSSSVTASPTKKHLDQSALTGTSVYPTAAHPPAAQAPAAKPAQPSLPRTGYDGSGALWLAIGSGISGLVLMWVARPRKRRQLARR